MSFFIPENIVTINEIPEGMVEAGPAIWVIDNVMTPEDCQKVLDFYERNRHLHRDGVTGAGLDKNVKDSRDMHLVSVADSAEADEIDRLFYEALHRGTDVLMAGLCRFPLSKVPFNLDMVFATDSGYQIQKTTPGGKYVWHIENAQVGPTADRTLTFIVYLNDVPVENDGRTGFLYQNVAVQPKAGRLVLFAPFWTHVHAGLPLLAGEKYIMTGWFHSSESQQ